MGRALGGPCIGGMLGGCWEGVRRVLGRHSHTLGQIKLSIKCNILRDGCATKLLITFHIFRHMKMDANTCKYDYCSSKLS